MPYLNHRGVQQMKKKISVVAAIGASTMALTGCQAATKNLGGNTTITLEPGQKLEEITWKDDDLWYLTRPMAEEDIAETHTFQQSSNWGVFEGTVTIVEQLKGEV